MSENEIARPVAAAWQQGSIKVEYARAMRIITDAHALRQTTDFPIDAALALQNQAIALADELIERLHVKSWNSSTYAAAKAAATAAIWLEIATLEWLVADASDRLKRELDALEEDGCGTWR